MCAVQEAALPRTLRKREAPVPPAPDAERLRRSRESACSAGVQVPARGIDASPMVP